MVADQLLGVRSPLPTPLHSWEEEGVVLDQYQNNALLRPELDSCFGWRWLLPLRDDDRVALAGFHEDEKAFWQRAIAPVKGFTDSLAEANVWIVNADRDGMEFDEVRQDFSRLIALYVVGSGKVVSRSFKAMSRHFPVVREYGLLPADNPRIVIPLDFPQHVSNALHLHRPGRYSARMALLLMRVLATMGNHTLLRRRVLYIALRDGAYLPNGAITAGLAPGLPEERGAFALYLGTPDQNRKTVILPVADLPQVVLKTASTPKSCRALQNEVSALRVLSASSLAPNIPTVVDVVERGDTLTLHQEYRQRQPVWGSRYREAVVDFQARLSTQNLRRRLLATILEESCLECGFLKRGGSRSVFPAVLRRLEQAAADGVMLWEHRSHGDFAPWNCAWTKKGLFVFDWEESRECAPAFEDAFYFVVAPAVYIFERTDPAKVTRKALRFAGEVAAKTGLPVEDLRLYWALWLLVCIAKADEQMYRRLLTELERKWR